MSQPGTRAGVDVRSIVRIREPLVAGFAILTWLMGVGTWRLIAWAGEEGVRRDVVILAMGVPSVVDLRVGYPSRHVDLPKDYIANPAVLNFAGWETSRSNFTSCQCCRQA